MRGLSICHDRELVAQHLEEKWKVKLELSEAQVYQDDEREYAVRLL